MDERRVSFARTVPTMSSWTTLLLVLVGGICSFAYLLLARRGKGKKLPPGPLGLPILGNLHRLGKLPHCDLHRLAKDYGPIMFMRLGLVPTVIVSSPEAAQEFLKTHDLVFANRPFSEAAKHIAYNRKGITFTEYGPYWRNARKLCTLELLSNLKIESFESTRREELDLLVQSLKDISNSRVAIDLSAKVASLGVDMTCMMVFGKKYKSEDLDERGFIEVVQETLELTAAFNIADYIPYFGAFDLQGLSRRMKAVSKVLDNFLEKIIDEHMQVGDRRNHKDFMDVMLSLMESKESEFQVDRTNIKAILLDMLVGAMETSACVVDWALSELLRNPRVMKKVQEELEREVGMERMVAESDLVNLEYMNMVIKESMRLHPVGPLLAPHEAMEDCTVNGFYIPRKSRVIINGWAIGRDPNSWPNAEEFLPERFIGTNIDLRGRDFQLIPFGSGRRSCPGMQLGLRVVQLVLAQLVHCFDWELPNGMSPSDLDMTEKFSLVVPRANHLLAIPTFRLHG
ncbi:cytochrome P450 71AU50-like [Tasmannia lanceolata]|uniref:cytochrome P450 71AU50-like n=1 Tax=Tasmannia lanceolata TaxID=3420 RepID=UPI004062C686